MRGGKRFTQCLSLGLLFVHLFQPGVGLAFPHTGAAAAAHAPPLTLKEFVTHLVPRSIVEAMAQNEILQIVVFAMFVGAAIAALDDRAPAVLALAEQVAAIMLKVTAYVMLLAPLVVFAALASALPGRAPASCSPTRNSWADSMSRWRCCGRCCSSSPS